jgi:hypothetical protein
VFEGLVSMDCEPAFCIEHIEDRLREVWMKSQVLAAMTMALSDDQLGGDGGGRGQRGGGRQQSERQRVKRSAVMESMQLDAGDFELLRRVAGSHTPLDDWLDCAT